MDRIRVLFFSPTHTSGKVACAIAKGVGGERMITDITQEGPAGEELVTESLTIVAAPVYGGRIPPVALERIRCFRSEGGKAIPVVVYGNRHYDDALMELTEVVREQGFLPVAAAAFVGEHSYSRIEYPVAAGRPDGEDLDRARQFGKQVWELVRNGKDGMLTIPGNHPYKEYYPEKAAPVLQPDLCTQCEYCVEICPVGAISMQEDELISDPEYCIHCCACVKFCPEEARRFDTPFSQFLYEHFSARREVEVFLPSVGE
ncbi:MAG: EFR1 family ferrodoxin [Bacteroides sp.]|nr:EFR1 family ferrodoxin [Bacteroides sp.]